MQSLFRFEREIRGPLLRMHLIVASTKLLHKYIQDVRVVGHLQVFKVVSQAFYQIWFVYCLVHVGAQHLRLLM